ncbi:MAG TPA: secretin N-terminal domain-containing protein, partial [Verrucomicrobiota bacterium]|nr:secretin N-terminal domain-containing protein [Verrucomicrobiota bacterium]
ATVTPEVEPGTESDALPALPDEQPPAATPTPPAPATPPALSPATPQPRTPPVPRATPAPSDEDVIPPGQINYAGAELPQVLQQYAELVNRTILRAPNLTAQPIILKTQTPLTKSELIQALDAVLAMNGIAMINIGEKFVKAVPIAQAEQEGQKPSDLDAEQLPEMGQYVTHILQLKTAKPSELVQVLTAFSKTKSIMPVDSSQIIVIRDFAENVKRMLEIIDQIDVDTPSEFISEVIPIKYAMAAEIASALNSLSGTGSGGTSVGGTTTGARTTTTGARMATGGAQSRLAQPLQTGGAAGATPGTASFSDRLQSIIRRASASGDVQVLGQTKIIADERTNSLLVFATRQDMAMIKKVVDQLDVVLAQVLIESIIMEVSLDDSRTVGFSYLQTPGTAGDFGGVGAIRNTTSFLNPANFRAALTNVGQGLLPSGFSYAANWNDDLYITAQAVEDDNRVKVLSRPRIQTSHAVPAQLFIGNTVPYITGTTYGDFSGATSRSVYEEKRVGITLDVLPLINPDGLVVMDIQQVIQQLGTPTTIDGNPVPTTTERSASAKVAVKNRETIILGGFIANQTSTTRSGVPILKDIPLLGFFFRSSGDSAQRVELIILMRPTVLPTPGAAAQAAADEKMRLPALRQAEYDEIKRRQKEMRATDRKIGTQPIEDNLP